MMFQNISWNESLWVLWWNICCVISVLGQLLSSLNRCRWIFGVCQLLCVVLCLFCQQRVNVSRLVSGQVSSGQRVCLFRYICQVLVVGSMQRISRISSFVNGCCNVFGGVGVGCVWVCVIGVWVLWWIVGGLMVSVFSCVFLVCRWFWVFWLVRNYIWLFWWGWWLLWNVEICRKIFFLLVFGRMKLKFLLLYQWLIMFGFFIFIFICLLFVLCCILVICGGQMKKGVVCVVFFVCFWVLYFVGGVLVDQVELLGCQDQQVEGDLILGESCVVVVVDEFQ